MNWHYSTDDWGGLDCGQAEAPKSGQWIRFGARPSLVWINSEQKVSGKKSGKSSRATLVTVCGSLWQSMNSVALSEDSLL